ncbi:Mu-like prophage major head subunit gpT family protein [Mannheimia haemolytica]|uniref:Mu-like prophage major head subunit gpT family protein n=1 Tax=Mannheimia haemolytica TaxID=75985 RepID=UPI0001BCF7E6|nr:Mu-like prophage major head subunit gpT family protein [Mannheimia haemolytica]EEY13314.1 putative major head subunit [Mannheimia haemolytica serotype A2 str. BOVINE]EPZ00487.1 head protein [Mannheimia haemolytica D35]MDW0617363.1 Mu-like prophage major head subunit gpT family protein [Mannheimia haemolytica]MDW0723585.1 Mu-like prophage major head subunit gpT family protein [Mannheimia haemolytica]MDW0736616.1 Mu-like prophage major head subunit gpT family protein [Mannheimia haemolytica]
MANVTPELVKALFVGFGKNFKEGLAKAPSQYTKIATVVKSTTASNTYGWLGQMPGLTEWIGDRTITAIQSHGYSIVNKKWASGVEIQRTDIEDDNVGIYSPLIEELGRAAGEKPDELVFSALKAGFSTACYDGQYFFDTDHPVGANVDGTSPKSVSNITDDSTGVSNENAWYLLDCSRSLKPIIYQERKAATPAQITDANDEKVFMKDVYTYGVDSRSNVGYGFWQQAHAVKGALTAENLWKAISAMRAVRGDGDKRLGIKPTHIVVPPSLEKEAIQLLEREFRVEDGATVDNEFKGRLELIVADYL